MSRRLDPLFRPQNRAGLMVAGAAAAALLWGDAAAGNQPPLPRPHPRHADAAAPAAAVAVAQLAEGVPLPRPKPGRQSGGAAVLDNLIQGAGALMALAEDPSAAVDNPLAAALASGQLAFESARQLIEEGDIAGAARVAASFDDPADTLLIEWLIATSGKPEVGSSRIAEAMARLAGWPGQNLLQVRFEQALVREKPNPAEVIHAFAVRPPVTDGATLLLAKAHLATGDGDAAAALIRPFWRTETFTESVERAVLSDFGRFLTAEDHKARVAKLLYDRHNKDAARVAGLLDADYRKLVEAWVAVNGRARNAQAALNAVPDALKSDPGYLYAKVLWLRRNGRDVEAAKVLASAPTDPAVLIDPDAWSSERRSIARTLVDQGDPRTAYAVLDAHAARERVERVEIAFQAGWVALRYLKDTDNAARHFRDLAASSSMPLSQSRSAYWLGRTADVAGNAEEAEAHYRRAAGYPTTFYGQLALVRLGSDQLTISAPAPPDDLGRAAFAANPVVRAMERLIATGEIETAELFARSLAETLDDPTQIAILAGVAETHGRHQLALQIGKLAQTRGLPADVLAFPTAAIPATDNPYVELPVVYAIARQESAFNPAAVSRAGARGLLQLMPGTARETARSIGLAYSESRLTRDAEYNTTLGSAHLGALFEEFDGSYVMAFAAYNAGERRVREWVRAYGDPRDPDVDVIDWIERIPFAETRNYVQRTLENLQVYKARLGNPALTIEADLRRGGRG